eukprot:SAG31_NODE_31579_length_366_cov_1.089888_1_plen_103_part_01
MCVSRRHGIKKVYDEDYSRTYEAVLYFIPGLAGPIAVRLIICFERSAEHHLAFPTLWQPDTARVRVQASVCLFVACMLSTLLLHFAGMARSDDGSNYADLFIF